MTEYARRMMKIVRTVPSPEPHERDVTYFLVEYDSGLLVMKGVVETLELRWRDTSAIAMGHRTGSMRIAMFEMEDVPDIMRDAYNEAKDNRRQAIEPPTLKLEAPIER